MRRSEIREHVFKLLFRVEFHDAADLDEQDKLYFEPLTLTEEHQKLITDRTKKIEEKLPEVDGKIEELCVGWKKERIGKVELTILRLAVFLTMMFRLMLQSTRLLNLQRSMVETIHLHLSTEFWASL